MIIQEEQVLFDPIISLVKGDLRQMHRVRCEDVEVMFCTAVFCNCRVNSHKTHQIKGYDVSLGAERCADRARK